MSRWVRTVAVACVVVTLSACEEGSGPERSEPTAANAPSPQMRSPREPQAFDRLSIELRLHRTTVASGGKIGSRIEVENRSGRSVTDPGCLLSAPSFALVPADDPDAELWGQIIVDCSGSFVMQPGFISTLAGPTFQASDKFGDPLPPGDYSATMQLRRLSEPLTVPVTVTP